MKMGKAIKIIVDQCALSTLSPQKFIIILKRQALWPKLELCISVTVLLSMTAGVESGSPPAGSLLPGLICIEYLDTASL